MANDKIDEWDKLAEVIELFRQPAQLPPPLPHAIPFATPDPMDALIEMVDNNKAEDEIE